MRSAPRKSKWWARQNCVELYVKGDEEYKSFIDGLLNRRNLKLCVFVNTMFGKEWGDKGCELGMYKQERFDALNEEMSEEDEEEQDWAW